MLWSDTYICGWNYNNEKYKYVYGIMIKEYYKYTAEIVIKKWYRCVEIVII